jgi:hypothetical protein
MNLVRKSIILSENGHIQRDMSDETFWHGVVADAVAVLELGRVSDYFSMKMNSTVIIDHSDIYRPYLRHSYPIKSALAVQL